MVSSRSTDCWVSDAEDTEIRGAPDVECFRKGSKAVGVVTERFLSPLLGLVVTSLGELGVTNSPSKDRWIVCWWSSLLDMDVLVPGTVQDSRLCSILIRFSLSVMSREPPPTPATAKLMSDEELFESNWLEFFLELFREPAALLPGPCPVSHVSSVTDVDILVLARRRKPAVDEVEIK